MINVMKKIIGSSLGILLPFVVAAPVLAAGNIEICPANSQFNALCNLTAENAPAIIRNIIVIILIIAVIIAVFFLIFGGIKWILSGGDKSKVESARNHIVAAIVGLIIALVAFFILFIVLRLVGVNANNFNLPNGLTQ